MPLLRWFIDEVVPNVIANLLADLFSPASMTGWATALACIIWLVIGWHRRQRAANKLGMASWPFIAVCFTVALLAIAGGAYGLGLKFANTETGTLQPAQPTTSLSSQTPTSSAASSPKRMYLRVDAEALTGALRQMHDILSNSVRDSTSMGGFSPSWSLPQRRGLDSDSLKIPT